MQDQILQKPIQQLDFTESFKEMAECHHFNTLQEILHWPANVLLMHKGFTYHHFEELREMLIRINGIHLLKSTAS